jgi:uncharacterized Zn finger protein (UPF0148 family)
MITYCSKCNTNWARLATYDGDDDEQVDVCPVCKTDSFLGDATGTEACIYCQITGRIVNPRSGHEKDVAVYKKPVIRVKVGMPERTTREEKEDIEMAAIDNYLNALKTGQDAHRAFFDTYKLKLKRL